MTPEPVFFNLHFCYDHASGVEQKSGGLRRHRDEKWDENILKLITVMADTSVS